MDINAIYTGKRYVYRKPRKTGRASFPLLVEVLTVDSSSNMVLVTNLNTGKVLNINANTLEPINLAPNR
jgi:hypothetical protein